MSVSSATELDQNAAVVDAQRRQQQLDDLEDAEFDYNTFKDHAVKDVDWRTIPLFDTTLNESTLNEETEATSIDLEALRNMNQELDPETEAENFKRMGNEAVKRGKEYRLAALKFYTKAIRCNVTDTKKRSIYFANRAHANLLGGASS
jgi:hypothetical protein